MIIGKLCDNLGIRKSYHILLIWTKSGNQYLKHDKKVFINTNNYI